MNAEFKRSPVVTPFYDSYWLLLEDLTFDAVRVRDNKHFRVTVPAGFVTDLASIPVPLNAIYDKTGRYSSAGILHDYLYWTQMCDRESSDRLIKEGLKATGAGYLTRNTIKYGVLWFGWAAWNANAKARANGVERFVPQDKRSFPSHTHWADYQEKFGSNVVPPWKSPDDPNKKQLEAGICDIFQDE